MNTSRIITVFTGLLCGIAIRADDIRINNNDKPSIANFIFWSAIGYFIATECADIKKT